MLERVAGRPILTTSHIRSVQDLQHFFHTIISHPEPANSYVLNGRTAAPTSQRLAPPDTNLPKSKSAPEFRSLSLDSDFRASTNTNMLGPQRTPRQFVEYMVETDFLEGMPKPGPWAVSWQLSMDNLLMNIRGGPPPLPPIKWDLRWASRVKFQRGGSFS